jgi:hypothetical protein
VARACHWLAGSCRAALVGKPYNRTVLHETAYEWHLGGFKAGHPIVVASPTDRTALVDARQAVDHYVPHHNCVPRRSKNEKSIKNRSSWTISEARR